MVLGKVQVQQLERVYILRKEQGSQGHRFEKRWRDTTAKLFCDLFVISFYKQGGLQAIQLLDPRQRFQYTHLQ